MGIVDYAAVGKLRLFMEKIMQITWIHTPTTCKECEYYDAHRKRCTLKVCRYPAKRGRDYAEK